MRRVMIVILVTLLMFLVKVDKVEAALIFDHNSVSKFENIPDTYVSRAAALRMMIRNASVGRNIGGPAVESNSGLDYLYNNVNKKYDRSNWLFQSRGNPSWTQKFQDFKNQVELQKATKDVMMVKLCFRDEDQLASSSQYIQMMEELVNANPTKKFVWWTIPIRVSSTALAANYNKAIRDRVKSSTYVNNNNIILYDIADIESHDGSGNMRVVGGFESMQSAWADSDGGHLGMDGKIRTAKVFWVMMATLAGWDGSGAAAPTNIPPTATVIPAATNTPSVNCGYKNIGDANCDTIINLSDFTVWVREFKGTDKTKTSDFNKDGAITLADFVVWVKGFKENN